MGIVSAHVLSGRHLTRCQVRKAEHERPGENRRDASGEQQARTDRFGRRCLLVLALLRAAEGDRQGKKAQRRAAQRRYLPEPVE